MERKKKTWRQRLIDTQRETFDGGTNDPRRRVVAGESVLREKP